AAARPDATIPADAVAGLETASVVGSVDQARLERVLATVTRSPSTSFTLVPGTGEVAVRATRPEPDALVALGVDVHRLRCALAAVGLTSTWHPSRATITLGGPAEVL